MMRLAQFKGVVLAALLISFSAAAAQDLPRRAADRELAGDSLRAAIHRYFDTRLRQELSLSDEQMAAITPLVEEIETARSRLRRERADTVRALRTGLRDGATDDELQGLLDRLEAMEREQRGSERAVMQRIDEQLSVRQRVQFRFFIERFRQQLQRRIQEFRQGRPGRAGRGRPGPRGPGRDRP